MSVVRMALTVSTLLAAPALAAQQGGGLTTTPPAEASGFDFLLGQWELVVRPQATSMAARMHGTQPLVGVWKAWRAFDGFGIEDELRIMDGSGNPLSLSHVLRSWDAAAGRWQVVGLDVYGARVQVWSGTVDRRGVTLTTETVDQEGRPLLARIRFTDIERDRFRMSRDQSTDGGRSWDEGIVRFDARRVAAAAAR